MYYSVGKVTCSDQLGNVYKGKWRIEDCFKDVTVKFLKKKSGQKEKIIFLQEAIILNQLKHPNVVALCGVVKDGELVSTKYFKEIHYYDNIFIIKNFGSSLYIRFERLLAVN